MKHLLKLLLTLAALLTLTPDLHAQYRKIAFGDGNFQPVLLVDTNLYVRLNTTASNAAVAGTVIQYSTPIPVPTSNGTPANLAAVTVPAGALANNGDAIVLRAKGNTSAIGLLLQITNQFQVTYGALTAFDTGLTFISNAPYALEITFTRTGDNAIHADSRFESYNGGVYWVTNNNAELAPNNLADNTLSLLSTSRRQGSHTNNFFSVQFIPASR